MILVNNKKIFYNMNMFWGSEKANKLVNLIKIIYHVPKIAILNQYL